MRSNWPKLVILSRKLYTVHTSYYQFVSWFIFLKDHSYRIYLCLSKAKSVLVFSYANLEKIPRTQIYKMPQ